MQVIIIKICWFCFEAVLRGRQAQLVLYLPLFEEPWMSHAVAVLRKQRLAQCQRPFRARGAALQRCERCRVSLQYCICSWQPKATSSSSFCLLMHENEPLKPSNTGWLIADVLPQTRAFIWSRTEQNEELVRLLSDPQWQPYLVFPHDAAGDERQLLHELLPANERQPLFVLLDATWQQARKMFRKTPCLQQLPVLSLETAQLSRYHLRHSDNRQHLATAEVAALCLQLAGEQQAADSLQEWFARFNRHYLAARTPPGKEQRHELLS